MVQVSLFLRQKFCLVIFYSALLKTTLHDIGHLYKELHYYYYCYYYYYYYHCR